MNALFQTAELILVAYGSICRIARWQWEEAEIGVETPRVLVNLWQDFIVGEKLVPFVAQVAFL